MTFRRYAPIGRVAPAGLSASANEVITGQWTFEADVHLDNGTSLFLYDSTDTDSVEFSHDGTDFNTTFTNTSEWNINSSVLITDGGLGLSASNGIQLHYDTGSKTGYMDIRDSAGTYGYGDMFMRCIDLSWFVVGTANVSSIGAWTGGGNTTELTGGTITLDAATRVVVEDADLRISNGTDWLDFDHDGTDFNITPTNTTDINFATGADVRVADNLFANNLPYIADILTSDFTTTITTPTDVGLDFTCAANTVYLIEFFGMVETTSSTNAPQIGFSFPTGATNQTGEVQWGFSTAADSEPKQASFMDGGTLQIESTASSVANQAMPVWGFALIDMGATPVGNFSVQLEGEVGGTTYTLRAGSFIRVTVVG